MRILGKAVVLALLAPTAALALPRVDAPAGPAEAGRAILRTPDSIREEHQEIHAVLNRASAEPGELGEAARRLRDLLDPHFRREEEIATPPLALLGPLAHGPATRDMRTVLPMTQALERELPRMLAEHRRIGVARERFEAAARAMDRADYLRFCETLAHHARQEEEVLYPAAILVGRYVGATTKGR